MNVSRMIWAWQRGFFERAGWAVEGGIWPRLRVVRPTRLDDFFYGDGHSSKGLGGLADLWADPGPDTFKGGVMVAKAWHWKTVDRPPDGWKFQGETAGTSAQNGHDSAADTTDTDRQAPLAETPKPA